MLQVFFILRKKHAQISFLHVYHHIMILMVGWMGTKYYPPATYPGGPCLLFGLVNCFVHMFMYYYYLRSVTRGPNLNSMTWKKYVTVLQLVNDHVHKGSLDNFVFLRFNITLCYC